MGVRSKFVFFSFCRIFFWHELATDSNKKRCRINPLYKEFFCFCQIRVQLFFLMYNKFWNVLNMNNYNMSVGFSFFSKICSCIFLKNSEEFFWTNNLCSKMLHFTNIELKTKFYTHITIIIMFSTFDNFLGILRNTNIYI